MLTIIYLLWNFPFKPQNYIWHLFDLTTTCSSAIWRYLMQINQKWTTRLNKSLADFLKLASSSELQSTRCNVNDNFINSAEDSTKVFRYCQSSREVNSLQTRGAFRHLDFSHSGDSSRERMFWLLIPYLLS